MSRTRVVYVGCHTHPGVSIMQIRSALMGEIGKTRFTVEGEVRPSAHH